MYRAAIETLPTGSPWGAHPALTAQPGWRGSQQCARPDALTAAMAPRLDKIEKRLATVEAGR